MKESILNYIVCPECKSKLSLTTNEKKGNEIISGLLKCDKNHSFNISRGVPILLLNEDLKQSQKETQDSFSKKWTTMRKFCDAELKMYREWYVNRYGWKDEQELISFLQDKKLILDAGCGLGRDTEYFSSNSKSSLIFGLDISDSIFVTYEKLKDEDNIHLIKGDLSKLPFNENYFDFISCDQVIHHTPNPEYSYSHLVKHTKKNGTINTYVYKKKAPMREFTDDFIRKHTTKMSFDECYELCESITKLGKALSDLKKEVEIPEDIPLLGIKKGKMDVQRFIYWNFIKCFWNDDFGFDTCVMYNVDWYHPKDAFRYSEKEIKEWINNNNLKELYFDICDSGISIRTKKE